MEVKVVLISTYELGRQPFGLASPAAWLRARGHSVTCADLAVGSMPSVEVGEADLVAFYLPMHTATRLAIPAILRVRELNAAAHLCCYGLYAPLNADRLRELGVGTVIGGEFEDSLSRLADSLDSAAVSGIFLDRLPFIVPDRARLPILDRYPKLVRGMEKKRVGYTEASRGCKHLCRHCPVVPVYGGAFRIVPADVVVADVRQQVAAGAEHITFGDPDFLNGPGHAARIVKALHGEYPSLTYDITAKIEHLLKHRDLLPLLRDTGCLFVTTAVESVDDAVLRILDKGHTEADFAEVVGLFGGLGLALAPTFIPFTPWTTVAEFGRLLQTIWGLDLVDHVAPVQWSLRLLIPAQSRLLELDDVRRLVGAFDAQALVYPWRHPNPAVDILGQDVQKIVRTGVTDRKSRLEIFREVWEAAHGRPAPEDLRLLPRTVIPYMEEPWFC